MAFRKAYLRLFVDCVVVSDTEDRIRGPKASLAKMAMLGSLPSAADMVPSFVREWRPLRDSNPRCRRERGIARRKGEQRRTAKVPAITAETTYADNLEHHRTGAYSW
jgi:hypothetical protein